MQLYVFLLSVVMIYFSLKSTQNIAPQVCCTTEPPALFKNHMRGICLSKENALFFLYCGETHEQRLQQACTRSRADRPARKSPGTPEIAYFRDSRDFSGGLSGRLPVQFSSSVARTVHMSPNANPQVYGSGGTHFTMILVTRF